MKPLILCADDFAVHEAASSGIMQLVRAGRLSATSAMVLSPRWAQDAQALRDLRGRMDVGLHLDWTSDFALAAGHGTALNRLMARAAWGAIDTGAAREVIQRQLDAFELQWLAPPDHIDGHQHVQQFRGIRQALVQVLHERYGPRPPYVRLSRVPAAQRNFKSGVIAAMGANRLAGEAAALGIPVSRWLSGVYDFSGGGQRYAQRMHYWLQTTDAGIIMCHPARQADPGDPIGAARRWEFDYLYSDAFADTLNQTQVVLSRGPG